MLIKQYNNYANRIRFERFLASLGFSVVVDGVDDAQTDAAIRAFQKANALKADGSVGDLTLKAAKAKGFDGFEAVAPVTTVAEAEKTGEKVILVSAGHTNNPRGDQGAVGNNCIEGVEALNLRDDVADELRKQGIHVLEDGADGENEPLKKALLLVKKAKAAVEIHFNAGGVGANGVEVLCKPKYKPLAQKFGTAVAHALGLTLRGDRGWKADNSGQHHRLAFCEAGGMILEVCFISSSADMAAYRSGREALVQAIANVLKAA